MRSGHKFSSDIFELPLMFWNFFIALRCVGSLSHSFASLSLVEIAAISKKQILALMGKPLFRIALSCRPEKQTTNTFLLRRTCSS